MEAFRTLPRQQAAETATGVVGPGVIRWAWPKRYGVGDVGCGSAGGMSVQLRELRGPGAGRAPAAGDPALGRWRAGRSVAGVPAALRAERATLDPAGKAAAGALGAGILLGPLRAAAELQTAVPLVRRAGGRRAVWDVTVFTKEPRPAARGQDRCQVLRHRAGAARARAASLR